MLGKSLPYIVSLECSSAGSKKADITALFKRLVTVHYRQGENPPTSNVLRWRVITTSTVHSSYHIDT